MMQAAVEPFTATLPEIKALLPEHHAELALFKDRMAFDPMWETYEALDKAGAVLLVTLREGVDLVGYYIAFVLPALHYRGCLTATQDVWWMRPEYRGRRGELRLMRAVKAELIRRGVQNWFADCKSRHPIGRLYEALGFKEEERWYALWLGDTA